MTRIAGRADESLRAKRKCPEGCESQYEPFTVNGDESPLPAKPIDHVPLLEVLGSGRLPKESDYIRSTLTVLSVTEHEPIRDPIAPPERIVPIPFSNTPPSLIEWLIAYRS